MILFLSTLHIKFIDEINTRGKEVSVWKEKFVNRVLPACRPLNCGSIDFVNFEFNFFNQVVRLDYIWTIWILIYFIDMLI
jgi:hypothetical protein